MTVTVDQVIAYVGADPATDTEILTGLLAAATDMVKEELGESGQRRIPATTFDLACTHLTSELWTRRLSPNGVAEWSPDGSTPKFLPRDVMVSVDPLLARYKSLGACG